jgi:dTDP-4-amino-4,6-dideoxygalactose transaminase
MKKITVPLMDLKRQCAPIRDGIDTAARKILNSQQFVLGEDVKALEKSMASYCGAKFAVGVNSGTDALILALKAFGIGRGDEVITTPFTFIATAEAVARVGAKPVFVDIDPETYNINPGLIEERITQKTKAILPVHLYGLSAEMDSIMGMAKKRNLKVLEDCAQAIGSAYKGRKAGSIGDAAAFSFFPSKNLGASGDGGMVVTSSKGIYENIKLLRNHGSDRKYYHKIIGFNSRLDNLHAAVLNIKLPLLDGWIDKRLEIAEFFSRELRDYPVSVPHIPRDLRHSFHLYVLRSKNAKRMMEYLARNGIESRSYYPRPMHLQECFGYLGYKAGDFPESEKLARECFAIPIYPELSEEEKRYIVEKIRQFPG